MKCDFCDRCKDFHLSPSMRREWIEIFWVLGFSLTSVSPSMRREWIEMEKI